MIKKSSQNNIEMPNSGWLRNEMGELEIEYFSGSPYPTSIVDIQSKEIVNVGEESDEVIYNSSDDEEESDDFDDNDDNDDYDWRSDQ